MTQPALDLNRFAEAYTPRTSDSSLALPLREGGAPGIDARCRFLPVPGRACSFSPLPQPIRRDAADRHGLRASGDSPQVPRLRASQGQPGPIADLAPLPP